MVRADTTLTCVMGETTDLGSRIQRFNRVATERAKAHGGNIQRAGSVGLFTIFISYSYTRMMVHLMKIDRHDGMAHPLISLCVNIKLRSEWGSVYLLFG